MSNKELLQQEELSQLYISSWADEYDDDMYDVLTEEEQKYMMEIKTKKDECNTQRFSQKICERKCNIDYKRFKIVNNSRYSSLMPWYVNQVNTFLKDMFQTKKINGINMNNTCKIVDAGANIGVDSINFLLNFPKSRLIALEIDKDTHDILCDNMLEFSHITKVQKKEDLVNQKSKVQVYNKDFLLTLSYAHNADIVFIDAPWGGKIYKDKLNVSVYMQPEDDYYNVKTFDENKNIINITKLLLGKTHNVKSVLLKVPYNYEFAKLNSELFKYNNNVKIHKKNVFKGNTNYIAFVLVLIHIQ